MWRECSDRYSAAPQVKELTGPGPGPGSTFWQAIDDDPPPLHHSTRRTESAKVVLTLPYSHPPPAAVRLIPQRCSQHGAISYR